MKTTASLLLILFSFMCQQIFAHGTEPDFQIKIKESFQKKAGLVNIQFTLRDTFFKKDMTLEDLETTAEDGLRGVIFDTGLADCHAVNFKFEKGFWTTAVQIPRNGLYWIWLFGTQKGSHKSFSLPASLKITDGLPANKTNVKDFPEKLLETDTHSQVTLLPLKKIIPKQPMKMKLQFSRTDGNAPQLTPIAGSDVQLIVTKWPGSDLFHAHPQKLENSKELLVDFPEGLPVEGSYRMWVEFKDMGTVKIIPLAFKVDKK